VPLLAAIDAARPPSSAMLETRALDPAQHCAWLGIPARDSCAFVQGSDTIFRAPFENPQPDLDRATPAIQPPPRQRARRPHAR